MDTEFIDSLKSGKSLPFSLSCNLLCLEILCRTQNGTKSFLITHSWVKGVCRVVFRICACDAAEEWSFSRARPRKCVDLWVRSSCWWTETEQSLVHTGERSVLQPSRTELREPSAQHRQMKASETLDPAYLGSILTEFSLSLEILQQFFCYHGPQHRASQNP